MNSITRRDLLKAGAAVSLSPLARLALCNADEANYTFAFFSDTHVGLKNNVAEDAAMFAEIKALNPAFCINGGDVTDYGWAGEFGNYLTLIKDLGFPIHNTPGNHDVRWSPQGVKLFRELLGEPYAHFEKNGVHFFTLDSTVPLSHWGHFESEQLRWLGAELKQVGRSAPVFLSAHHWVGRDTVMVDNEEELRRVIEAYNVKIILNGHGHSDLLWVWDGIVNTMNKGLYQGSWEKVDVDFAKREIRLSRRTTAKPRQTLIATVPLDPPREKRPVWATGAGLLDTAYSEGIAAGAQVRSNYGVWLDGPAASSLPMLLGRSKGEQLIEIRDPRTKLQGTYFATTKSDKVEQVWRAELTGGVMSHIAVLGNRVFVSAMDGSVVALDKDSGHRVWRAKTGRYCHSSPVVDGDLLFVGSADGNLYCFDSSKGKEVWRAKTEGPVYASAAVAQGTVCVASGDGKFYGFHRSTGNVRWTYTMPPSNTAFAQSAAATDGQRFYIGAWDSNIYAIEAASGHLIWRQPCFPRTFAWSPAIGGPAVDGGNVYVPANGNGLFCFDAVSGDQKWMVSSKTDKYGHSSPRVHEGKIYVGGLGDNGELRCVSAKDGSLEWLGRTGSVIYDSSPAVGEGFVAIGSVASLLSVFKLQTGDLHEQVRLPVGHFLSSPYAEGNRIYAGSYSNTVTCFEVRGL
jgi:outer membrane protein assembly factor BamB